MLCDRLEAESGAVLERRGDGMKTAGGEDGGARSMVDGERGWVMDLAETSSSSAGSDRAIGSDQFP